MRSQHCNVAGEALHAHARHWDDEEPLRTHSDAATHACPAKKKNCQRRALSNSGAERGEKDWGRAGYQRRARTSTGIERKATKIKSKTRKEEERQRGLRRERAWRISVGEFMHLTGDYTPALHMSSILSFKSSLQEDRTKHRDNHSQRHKHKIIKEPQTQLQ